MASPSEPECELNEYLGLMTAGGTTLELLLELINASDEKPACLPTCKVLTQAGLDIANAHADKHTLIFIENPSKVLQTVDKDKDKPDIVAFWGTRTQTQDIISKGLVPSPPSAYEILSGAELKPVSNADDQGMRYARVLTRHRPASSMQHILAITKENFYLCTLQLDREIRSEDVPWVDSQESWDGKASGPVIKALRKLWQCVKMIRDEASLPHHSPKLSMVLKNSSSTVALYTVQAGGTEYHLLPIYVGKGTGRKPFVALGVDPTSPSKMCVFKYSWCPTSRRTKESEILRKIHNDGFAPGVVRLNTALTQEMSLQSHGAEGDRERRLLVLDTIGQPLCSCTSALEFLEAMYDLLEVLRFLAAEKKVLHRDVSWENVLIKPQHVSGEMDKEAEPDVRPKPSSNAGSTHNYRFISDIYGEDKLRVRVALSDFDYAVDLESEEAVSELSYATGTPMFMANDVIFPSIGPDMRGQNSAGLRLIGESVKDDYVVRMKYGERRSDAMDATYKVQLDEKDFWDKFYKTEMKDLSFIKESKPEASFRQAAVHDAESVFYLCILFFLRMRPIWDDDEDKEKTKERSEVFEELVEKQVGVRKSRAFQAGGLNLAAFNSLFSSALEVMCIYLLTPWYNVRDTGRGELYEFHMHDFMQRLILRSILAIQNKDHVALQTEPLRVYLDNLHHDCNGFSSSSASVMKLIDGIAPSKVHAFSTTLTPQKSQNQESNENGSDIPEPRVPEEEFAAQRTAFPELFWTILLWKKRERLWIMADEMFDRYAWMADDTSLWDV